MYIFYTLHITENVYNKYDLYPPNTYLSIMNAEQIAKYKKKVLDRKRLFILGVTGLDGVTESGGLLYQDHIPSILTPKFKGNVAHGAGSVPNIQDTNIYYILNNPIKDIKTFQETCVGIIHLKQKVNLMGHEIIAMTAGGCSKYSSVLCLLFDKVCLFEDACFINPNFVAEEIPKLKAVLVDLFEYAETFGVQFYFDTADDMLRFLFRNKPSSAKNIITPMLLKAVEGTEAGPEWLYTPGLFEVKPFQDFDECLFEPTVIPTPPQGSVVAQYHPWNDY